MSAGPSWADQLEGEERAAGAAQPAGERRRGRSGGPPAPPVAAAQARAGLRAGPALARAQPRAPAQAAMARPEPAWLAAFAAEQTRVRALQGEELTQYTDAARERVSLPPPFALSHADVDAHEACRRFLIGLTELLIAFAKCRLAGLYEQKALVLLKACFTGAAADTWYAAVNRARATPSTGPGQASIIYRAFREMLAFYTDRNAHKTMAAQLENLKFNDKGLTFTKAEWSAFIAKYDGVAALTADLPLPLQLPVMTWEAGWFPTLKKRLPAWALKVIIEHPDAFNNPQAFWDTLAQYEPARANDPRVSGVRALAHPLAEAAPWPGVTDVGDWRDAALNAYRVGNYALGDACLDAENFPEAELMPPTPAHLHALAQGAPLLARNGKPINCFHCGENHRVADCPHPGANGGGGGGVGGGGFTAGVRDAMAPTRQARPSYAPPLVQRPGLGATGPTFVAPTIQAPRDNDVRASILSLSAKVEAQGEQLERVFASFMAAQAQTSTAAPLLSLPRIAPVMVAPHAPEGYVQIGHSNLGGGAEEVPVWASESALLESENV